MNQILEADSILLEYGGRKILQNIYIKMETGKITGLLGRNGTGKSSLMRMIFGTLRGQSQSVRVQGRFEASPYLNKTLIRYLPQNNFVPASFSIEQLCVLYHVSWEEILNYFPDLAAYKKEKVGYLSVGKIRLVEVLLILLSPVAFILLDEPFKNLDPIIIEKLKPAMADQKMKKGILVSDHHYQQVLDIADDVYLLVPVGRCVLLKQPQKELRHFGYIHD